CLICQICPGCLDQVGEVVRRLARLHAKKNVNTKQRVDGGKYAMLHLPRRVTQAMLAMLLLSLTVMTAACGGDPQAQQQASHNKAQLDQTLKHAQQIGVPASMLHPIVIKEQQVSSTGAPFSLFNDQPITDYYKNQANSYANLLSQTLALIANTTNQMQLQAQNDMQV